MTIQDALTNFKRLIETAITTGGDKAKTAMIRSSRPILNIHEAVKSALTASNINPNLIYPPILCRNPELKLTGSLKHKDQDICVIPNSIKPVAEQMTDGLLKGIIDPFGKEFTRHTLAINVRSQISSVQKNFDTLYERTISEAQNLHDRCPDMVLGEVYLLAVPEYNSDAIKNNQCIFNKVSPKLVEQYIKSFQAIANRNTTQNLFYQYEAVCLLIVDFSTAIPKIYATTDELKNAGLLPPNSSTTYEGLEWDKFTTKILSVYNRRFGIGNLS